MGGPGQEGTRETARRDRGHYHTAELTPAQWLGVEDGAHPSHPPHRLPRGACMQLTCRSHGAVGAQPALQWRGRQVSLVPPLGSGRAPTPRVTAQAPAVRRWPPLSPTPARHHVPQQRAGHSTQPWTDVAAGPQRPHSSWGSICCFAGSLPPATRASGAAGAVPTGNPAPSGTWRPRLQNQAHVHQTSDVPRRPRLTGCNSHRLGPARRNTGCQAAPPGRHTCVRRSPAHRNASEDRNM